MELINTIKKVILNRLQYPYVVKSKLINLGCGTTVHKAWDNFDLNPSHHLVKPLNILEPLPFQTGTYNVCYTSHVLEHLPRSHVSKFLSEIHRILQPGGVVRIVVPDFEQQARQYLRYLDLAAQGDLHAQACHEWMTIEIVDQLTRPFSGGFMGRMWSSRPLPARELIVQRLGQEAEKWLTKLDKQYRSGAQPLHPNELYAVPPTHMTSETEFRSQGEVHRWIYDRVSLGILLKHAGFQQTRICNAKESYIPKFASYHLDTDAQGNPRKPDSLFMEGIV